MMKVIKSYKILVLMLIGINLNNLQAQSKVKNLPADSLLKWFEGSNHPFDVWDSIRAWKLRSKNRTSYDYKSYYFTPSLKPYLLKWLDRDLIKEQKIDQYLNEKRINMDPEKSYDSIDHRIDSIHLSNEIKKLLKQQGDSTTIDSVLTRIQLFNSYKEAVIEKSVQKSKMAYQKELNPFPDRRTISFHMNLAYPESYQLIKSFWEEKGKGTDRNDYFIALVKMGDQEARAIFDQYVMKIVKTNGHHSSFGYVISRLEGVLRGSSYGTTKFIELLEVDVEIDPFDDGNAYPFNCDVIDILLGDIFHYNIEVDAVVKYRDPCEEDVKHLLEIKLAAQKLIDYYKDQENYWMSNIPH